MARSPPPHVNLSAYYNRTGDPAKALEYADKALALDPESDRAWFQKGRADERQGRLDEAVDVARTGPSRSTRARRPITTSSPASTAGSAGRTRARRRWRRSSASSAKPASSRQKRRSGNDKRRPVPGRRVSSDRQSRRAVLRVLAGWRCGGDLAGLGRPIRRLAPTGSRRPGDLHGRHRGGGPAAGAVNVSGSPDEQAVPARGNGRRRRVLRLRQRRLARHLPGERHEPRSAGPATPARPATSFTTTATARSPMSRRRPG